MLLSLTDPTATPDVRPASPRLPHTPAATLLIANPPLPAAVTPLPLLPCRATPAACTRRSASAAASWCASKPTTWRPCASSTASKSTGGCNPNIATSYAARDAPKLSGSERTRHTSTFHATGATGAVATGATGAKADLHFRCDACWRKDGLISPPTALRLYVPSPCSPFCSEVQLHGKLAHPNVIGLYGAFQVDSQVVMVQEFADGGDLFTLLHRWGGAGGR